MEATTEVQETNGQPGLGGSSGDGGTGWIQGTMQEMTSWLGALFSVPPPHWWCPRRPPFKKCYWLIKARQAFSLLPFLCLTHPQQIMLILLPKHYQCGSLSLSPHPPPQPSPAPPLAFALAVPSPLPLCLPRWSLLIPLVSSKIWASQRSLPCPSQ